MEATSTTNAENIKLRDALRNVTPFGNWFTPAATGDDYTKSEHCFTLPYIDDHHVIGVTEAARQAGIEIEVRPNGRASGLHTVLVSPQALTAEKIKAFGEALKNQPEPELTETNQSLMRRPAFQIGQRSK